VPIAAPLLIESVPSNEAHRLTPEQPQAPPNEPSNDLAKEAADDRPPPLETPGVSILKKQWKWSRAAGALALLGVVCAALAIFTLSNIRSPVVSASLAPSESQDKLEAVARRLLIEALTACKAGAQPKVEDWIETNSAEPDRPVLRPPPTLPRGIDRDTLKGSCGTWFNCKPIFEESK
jgi:hypothetical protein